MVNSKETKSIPLGPLGKLHYPKYDLIHSGTKINWFHRYKIRPNNVQDCRGTENDAQMSIKINRNPTLELRNWTENDTLLTGTWTLHVFPISRSAPKHARSPQRVLPTDHGGVAG